jgi:hypothetical protein
MTTAIPRQPTIGSIVIGIALFIVAFLAFLRLPDVVKFAGVALMYVPAKVGLVDMITPQEVIPFSLAENPSTVTFTSSGQYLLYLNNYDLLVIHDAVVASDSKPWLKIQSENLNTEVELALLSRGLAWYDTPFAPGRPVVSFRIDQPGEYKIIHPTRLDSASIVPDTTSGKEPLFTFWALVEVALLGGAIFYLFRARTASERQQRNRVRAENRARVEKSWKRIKQRADDKRHEEDGPYWKKQ